VDDETVIGAQRQDVYEKATLRTGLVDCFFIVSNYTIKEILPNPWKIL
jgi:hypothetical protein